MDAGPEDQGTLVASSLVASSLMRDDASRVRSKVPVSLALDIDRCH
jgi:hypothetical protein